MKDPEVINYLSLHSEHTVNNFEIRKDTDISPVALNSFTLTSGIAANLFRNDSPSEAIKSYKSQMMGYNEILKKDVLSYLPVPFQLD